MEGPQSLREVQAKSLLSLLQGGSRLPGEGLKRDRCLGFSDYKTLPHGNCVGWWERFPPFQALDYSV